VDIAIIKSMIGLVRKLSSLASVWVLIPICFLSFVLMLQASLGDSGVMDELAHIPAGYGYIHDLDYRLNPEHPPLIKALAALPLLFMNLNFPTKSSAWTQDINGQWAMGTQFLYESGNDANQVIRWARLGPMLLTILLVVFIYIWSRELLGEWWALLPTLLFALSPTVLAHGHYVTTDVGAAFGVVFATYYFLRLLHEPSRKNLIWAGMSFGVAQILKFSAVLLLPFFAALLLIFYIKSVVRDWQQTENRCKKFCMRAMRYIKYCVVILLIGYLLIVYPVYALFTANYPIAKQSADTEFILTSFASGPTPQGQICKPTRCLADLNIWMSKHAPTRPLAEYMLGVLMVLQRSSGGNTAYFLGEVSAVGSPWYFPIIYLLKESLPALIMTLLALVWTTQNILRRVKNQKLKSKSYFLDYLELNFAEFSMALFIIFYWAWSIRSPLNIGFRHLFPTLPFIYILTTTAWKKWVMKIDLGGFNFGLSALKQMAKRLFAMSLKYVFLLVLLVWFIGETVFAAPYFLSYFNELGGGIRNGYKYVADSNYDWGQDLLRLQKFVATHPEIDKIAVDYFGAGNPKYYLGTKEVDWRSARGNPSGTQIGADETQINADNNIGENQRSNQRKFAIHWLAVSVNTLQSAIQPLAPGQQRNPEDEYRWLIQLRPQSSGLGNVPQPDYRAGTSIFIYKL